MIDIFLVKQGDEVKISGKQYTALKEHQILGVNLFEGKLKILSEDKKGFFIIRDYTYEELENSDLVSLYRDKPKGDENEG